MQWSQRVVSWGNRGSLQQTLTDMDLKVLAIMVRHIWVVMLSIAPLTENFLRRFSISVRDAKAQTVTYHAVKLMKHAEPGKIASSRKLNGPLPMCIEFCFSDTDAHVTHELVPCDVGFVRWRPGKRNLIEFGIKLRLVFD